jgi:hypothetical protein
MAKMYRKPGLRRPRAYRKPGLRMYEISKKQEYERDFLLAERDKQTIGYYGRCCTL